MPLKVIFLIKVFQILILLSCFSFHNLKLENLESLFEQTVEQLAYQQLDREKFKSVMHNFDYQFIKLRQEQPQGNYPFGTKAKNQDQYSTKAEYQGFSAQKPSLDYNEFEQFQPTQKSFHGGFQTMAAPYMKQQQFNQQNSSIYPSDPPLIEKKGLQTQYPPYEMQAYPQYKDQNQWTPNDYMQNQDPYNQYERKNQISYVDQYLQRDYYGTGEQSRGRIPNQANKTDREFQQDRVSLYSDSGSPRKDQINETRDLRREHEKNLQRIMENRN